MGGDGAEHRITHIGKKLVIGQITRPDQLDPGLVETALHELFGEDAGLYRRNEYEDRLRGSVARALQEWSKIRILQRHANRFYDLTAGRQVAILERRLGLLAWRKVAHDRHDLLDIILDRPVRHD